MTDFAWFCVLGLVLSGLWGVWRSLPTLLQMNFRADQRAALKKAAKGEG